MVEILSKFIIFLHDSFILFMAFAVRDQSEYYNRTNVDAFIIRFDSIVPFLKSGTDFFVIIKYERINR